MGDSIYTNPMMLGFAWQKGWVPLARESLLRAIELNARGGRQQQGRLRVGPPGRPRLAAVEALLAPGAR